MPFLGKVEIDHGGFESRVSEVLLHKTEPHPGFEQRGGVGMPEGRDGHAQLDDPGTLCGFTEGALDAVATHGLSCGRHALLIAAGGGKEPGLVTVGCPVGS